MSDIIRNWRFDDAAKVLTGGRRSPEPPPKWKCWIQPSPPLPIDEAVTTLIQSNKIPHLRPKEELEERGFQCPYYAVRWGVAMAVDAATVAAKDDPADMASRWRAAEEFARAAQAPVAAIAESLKRDSRAARTRWPLTEPLEGRDALELVFKLHQTNGLEHIAKHAHSTRQLFQNNQGDIWRLIFAADLGFTWVALTSERPARNDHYLNFVAAAFSSLGNTEISWERAVRRALALGLDWERYEKFFKNDRKFTSIGRTIAFLGPRSGPDFGLAAPKICEHPREI
jgi:hypothetical protein